MTADSDDEPELSEADLDAIPTVYTDEGDVTALGELAEAERAAARGGAAPAQVRGLRAVERARRTEDRVALWRSDQEADEGGAR
jgi:hypothetical protein